MRRIVTASTLMLLALAATPPANAENDDVLRRLMAEPLTLFDWGLAHLDWDMARAAAVAAPAGVSTSTNRPAAGASYYWVSRSITLYAAYPVPPSGRTAQACLSTFEGIVAALVAGAPGGPDAAGWYLREAFQPKGRRWGSLYEDVGARLLETVRLEVTLNPSTVDAVTGNGGRVRCSGRLDSGRDAITVEGHPRGG